MNPESLEHAPERLAALLVAGGHGQRFGAEAPKQFQLLEGRMLLEYAAEALQDSPLVHGIVVVVPPGWEDRLRSRLTSAGLAGKLVSIVAGGETRRDSVWRGLEALDSFTHVLIHDAARPFLTQSLIRDTVAAVHAHGAATAAVAVSDTLMRGAESEERAVTTVNREAMWAVQTPQVFALELIRSAHRRARDTAIDVTDDGSLILELGETLDFVPGNWWNIKVTRPEDLHRARCILKMRAVLTDEDD